MTEIEFIESIDCNFPYKSRKRWKEAIKTGNAISANAAFMSLHEICRPPASANIQPEQQFSMVGFWGKNFNHALKEPMMNCAKRMTQKNYLQSNEAIELMNIISAYPGQYNALGIASASVEDDFEKVEEAYQNIIDQWENLPEQQTQEKKSPN